MQFFNQLLVSCFFLGFSLSTSSAIASDTPVIGHLTSIVGEVFIDDQPVTQTTRVRQGSVISSREGRAVLLLGKETVVHIAPRSRVVVTEISSKPDGSQKAAVELKDGKSRALVRSKGIKKEFTIRSRNSTMGVRGTEIYAEAVSGQEPRFATLEGLAVVESPGARPQPLSAGQVIATGGSIEPISVEQGRALANQVAPRAQELKTSEDIANRVESGEQGRERLAPETEAGAERRPPPGPPKSRKFDPLRDGLRVPVGVRAVIRR